MNIFIVGFVMHDDILSNEKLQNVYAQRPSNLVTLVVNQVPVSYNYGNQYAYVSPQEVGVNTFPAVVFLAEYEPGKYTDVDKITGNFTEQQVINKVISLQNAAPPDAPGQGGIIPTDNTTGNGLGLGLIPTWLLIAIAAGAGYKAYRSKEVTGTIIFGGISAYLTSHLLK